MSYLPAVVEALRFRDPSADSLVQVPEDAWPKVLDELDVAQLTLAVGARCGDSLPVSVRARIDRNLRDNAIRCDRLLTAHRELDRILRASGIDYIVLKGLSQWTDYCDDPRTRPQYDIDIYVPGDSIAAAGAAVRELGYEPAGVTEDPGADHLPVLIRKTGWTWRHDYFDPDMPPSLELHFRLWNPDRIGFDVPGVGEFWRRRTQRNVDFLNPGCLEPGGFGFPALNRADGLNYSSLHLVRHLLGGDLKLRHVYEIAHFLESSAADHAFWSAFSCGTVEGIAFRLARDWFHCRLHSTAADAIDRLPAPVQRWFALFARTPFSAGSESGKNELWLHFALIDDRRDRFRIARRRLFPTQRSRVVRSPHLPDARIGVRTRVSHIAYQASFFVRRAAYHVRALVPVVRGALLWRGH